MDLQAGCLGTPRLLLAVGAVQKPRKHCLGCLGQGLAEEPEEHHHIGQDLQCIWVVVKIMVPFWVP